MNELEVLVAPGSLDKGDHSITGHCVIRVGGEEFPGHEWSDFVVVVLGWWLSELHAAEAGETVELLFMDGPYLVRVEPTSEGAARLEFVKKRISGEVVKEYTVSLKQALEACQLAASTVLDACHERGWYGPDVEKLRDLVGSARSV